MNYPYYACLAKQRAGTIIHCLKPFNHKYFAPLLWVGIRFAATTMAMPFFPTNVGHGRMTERQAAVIVMATCISTGTICGVRFLQKECTGRMWKSNDQCRRVTKRHPGQHAPQTLEVTGLEDLNDDDMSTTATQGLDISACMSGVEWIGWTGSLGFAISIAIRIATVLALVSIGKITNLLSYDLTDSLIWTDELASFILRQWLMCDAMMFSFVVITWLEWRTCKNQESCTTMQEVTVADDLTTELTRGRITGVISKRFSQSWIFKWIEGSIEDLRRGLVRKPNMDLPIHRNTFLDTTTAQVATDRGIAVVQNLLFLLLCHNEGRYGTRLLQLNLVTLQATSDRSLFDHLRCNYQSMRRTWTSWLSLRTLLWIKFVNFDMYPSEFVDVRKIDDIPPAHHTEYRYDPVPPEVIPPIGDKHMMHLFHHPECAGESSICVSRFPKKLKEKLRCCPIKGVNPGWGLQFVEGWDERKIWIIVFIIFVLGSLLVAIMLLILGRSLQDAFSVAAYMATTATVTIGFVQAVLA